MILLLCLAALWAAILVLVSALCCAAARGDAKLRQTAPFPAHAPQPCPRRAPACEGHVRLRRPIVTPAAREIRA
jgi:hypothetical protein